MKTAGWRATNSLDGCIVFLPADGRGGLICAHLQDVTVRPLPDFQTSHSNQGKTK